MTRISSCMTRLQCASSLAVVGAVMMAGPAFSQTATPAAPAAAAADAQEIVVSGFRASLNSALNEKRNETAAIDSIKAEDIGKFPDANLAESMQRIPGVALSRGDGGEGRNIAVRGLGASFTRVRINGMEGTSQTGSSDVYGAANSGRSFDFNVFPTEIFNGLAVRKTPSADVEEGSLGATVDLSAPKPLDSKKDFTVSVTAKGLWNEISKKTDPRGSILVSKKFGDGRWGVLGSFAYQKRHIREVGYSAVDILSANTNGVAVPVPGTTNQTITLPFCTPVGGVNINGAVYTSPITKGADANNCYPGLPRTSTLAAYNAIANARRADLPNVPGSGAFLPRIPRYVNSTQNQERMGGTFTLQFRPDDRTDISVDLLYSRFDVTRRDNYISGLSFGRSITNNGQPMVSVKDVQLSSLGSLQYGLFDGVDVRSEGLVDHFVSTFKQGNFNFRHQFDDRLEITALVGLNQSRYNGKSRFQTFMDAIDTPNFSIDSRNGRSTPLLGFGIDVSNPASFRYGAAGADGTVLGGYSFQARPSRNETDSMTGEVNISYKLAEAVTLKFGGQFRRNAFSTRNLLPYTADTIVQNLPAGVSLASLTTQISGLDKLWGNGAPASWAAIDADKLISTFNIQNTRYCGIECGAALSRVREEVSAGYVMTTFNLEDMIGFKIRGDAGVRFVHTNQFSSAYVPVSGASPTGTVGKYGSVTRTYDNWLPSANIVIEPVDNLLLRLSAAKVLARAELGSLTPSSGVTATTRTGSIQNPYLDPIKANTFDAALEWYFRPGSLVSVAFFYKDIKTYIQSVTSQIVFNQLGLPAELLANTNTDPSELFNISRPTNTNGGPLKGIELNLQLPFTFLSVPVIKNFGILANYTRVTSKINYVLTATGVTTTADLVNLSKNTASGTIFYEDRKFSIRSTLNYRGPYIRSIPASLGSNLQGNAATLYMDASVSYNLFENLKLTVEAQNLTDEQNRLYIDSNRKDTLFQTRIGRTVMFGVNFQL